MSKGRKFGRRMPAWRRYARIAVGLTGKIIGGVVALSPTFRGLQTIAKGNFNAGAAAIAYDTIGIDTSNPNSRTPEFEKITRTVVVVAAGIGLIKLFSYVAKKV